MIKSYFRIAIRNFAGNKLYSFINIAGLSVGMAVMILIGLWIVDECSYEDYNPNRDRIAEVMQNTTFNGEIYTSGSLALPLAEELKTNYRDGFKHVILSWWLRDHILSAGEKKFTKKGKFMEPAAPEMLGLHMIRGTWAGLSDPSSILLSASVARALFGDGDPMNKTMSIDSKMSVRVTGVYEDLPQNSRFHDVLFLAPWELIASTDPLLKDIKTNWAYDAAEIYVQLADHADMGKLSAAIRNCKVDKVKRFPELAAYHPTMLLQPMPRWHLYSEFKNGVNSGGRIQFVWLFGIIGLFVLLLACINFMNLSTARSERRAKEVGIRKAIGSLRGQLIGQFLCESLLAVAIAFTIALLLVQTSLPVFNAIADKQMAIMWGNPWFWLLTLAFSVITGLVAGSYPAFYLSSFQAVKVLKGTFRAGRGTAIPRKVMVVLQFTVSVVLVIGTLVVLRQVRFAKDRPVGYDREGLISLQRNTPEYTAKGEALRNELLRTGVVVETAESTSPTTWVWESLDNFDWTGKDPGVQYNFGAIGVTAEYGKTVGLHFTQGRDFSRAFSTDSSALVLNEAAVKFMGLKNPVGERIKWGRNDYTVIGVIKNMIMVSPYEPVDPTIYYLTKSKDANFLFIRMKPGLNLQESLRKVQAAFQQSIPTVPFDYKWVDEDYAQKFAAEERIGKLAGIFSLLAIFISCLGLFGMASFMAGQRTKEIGVRKVLGASVFTVWHLLSKEFLLLVGISLLLAMPVAWYGMHKWLQGFPYRAEISWWIFAIAGISAVILTLLTVSYQAIRAALMNPVKSLRTE